MEPIEFGDVRDIIATLKLDRESLEFLATSLPIRNGFTRECWKILDEVDQARSEEERRRVGLPGLRVVIEDRKI